MIEEMRVTASGEELSEIAEIDVSKRDTEATVYVEHDACGEVADVFMRMNTQGMAGPVEILGVVGESEFYGFEELAEAAEFTERVQ